MNSHYEDILPELLILDTYWSRIAYACQSQTRPRYGGALYCTVRITKGMLSDSCTIHLLLT